MQMLYPTQNQHSALSLSRASCGVFSLLLDSILGLTQVAYVEPVTRVKTSALTSQACAPWVLARISHRKPGATNYLYDSSAGAGTFSSIIDGEDFDGNGHGTHVSGTMWWPKTYSFAKRTTLIGVNALNAQGSGSSAGVIAGIQWEINDAKSKGRIGKALANMSLGSIFSQATNEAVGSAVAEGLFIGVAASNDDAPAGLNSPASEMNACTVGASDKTDARASYSNFGSVVDIFAPGSEIISTWIGGPTNTYTISGTSMATPQIVGLGAYLIGLEGASKPIALWR